MSKLIKLTSEHLEQCRREFDDALLNYKISDGKINFTKTFGAIDRKAVVKFTEIAWLKMQTLVRGCDKEVAWHGVAMRGEDETKDEYIITDILVYPQEVTGATVNTDQEKYQTWLMNHEDDVFNNIRMQGHSHVNMGTTPSSVDLSLYERLLDQLDDDMFYIFMIYNKRFEKHIKIYDMKKNVLFETADVSVQILDGFYDLQKFMDESKEMIKDRVTIQSYPSYGSGNRPMYGYGGYQAQSAYGKKDEVAPGKQQAPAKSSKKNKRRGRRRKDHKADKNYQQMNFRQYCEDIDYDDDEFDEEAYYTGLCSQSRNW